MTIKNENDDVENEETPDIENTETDQEVDDNKYTVRDLINLAVTEKPGEFAQVFDQLMKDRIAVDIEAKRIDIGANMFKPKETE